MVQKLEENFNEFETQNIEAEWNKNEGNKEISWETTGNKNNKKNKAEVEWRSDRDRKPEKQIFQNMYQNMKASGEAAVYL